MSKYRTPLAYSYLALSMALVGVYIALSKPLAAALPVLLLAWLRFGIGALAMATWLRRPANEAPMTRQTRWLLFVESFFGNFLFTLCMITGVSMTGAVAASVTLSHGDTFRACDTAHPAGPSGPGTTGAAMSTRPAALASRAASVRAGWTGHSVGG